MSLRLAALATVLAATGCYREASQDSTMPEPQYVAGPPGGVIDPGYGYAPYADQSVGAIGDSEDAAPDALGNAASDDADGDAALDDVAQSGDATTTVTDDEIASTLDGYGEWVNTDGYGQVWRPNATVVGADFTPYESGGSWQYTDAGWAFACDYSWGWLPFHYGRWAWFEDYWGWVPDYYWGPAWVEWRSGGGVIGWRPLPPRVRDPRDLRRYDPDVRVRDHRRPQQRDAHWRFAATHEFSRPHIRAHRFGNAAEGLRRTSAVAAPPIRGTRVPTADLMRSRFARVGAIRDHRGARGIGDRPLRTYPLVAPPARGGQRPLQTYRPPAQTYRPPLQTYGPLTPGQRPLRTYQPPQGQWLQPGPVQPGQYPPVRTYQPGRPPVGTYTPGQPPRTYQPGQPPTTRPPLYRPPTNGQPYQPRPTRTWSPPAGSPAPTRTWSPPAGSPAPTRTWSPPASSPSPSRSWSPPASSSPSPSRSSSPSSSSSSSSSSRSSSSSSGSHRR